MVQGKWDNDLRAALGTDTERLENAIAQLRASLSPLADGVFQNKRGWVLIFSQQRGLRAALGEECVHVDHSGQRSERGSKNANGNEANTGLVQVITQLNPMVNHSDFHLPGSP